MSQAVAKVMVDQGVTNGSIVNLASIVGKVYYILFILERGWVFFSFHIISNFFIWTGSLALCQTASLEGPGLTSLSGISFLNNLVWLDIPGIEPLGVYHLHQKPGNSSWKIKASFHLEYF